MKDQPMMQEVDPYLGLMLRLYKVGDICVTLLQARQQKSNLAFNWMKHRFNTMLN